MESHIKFVKLHGIQDRGINKRKSGVIRKYTEIKPTSFPGLPRYDAGNEVDMKSQ